MTEEFFEHLFNEGLIDEKPYVMSLGEGTTDDELFGGTDIKHLQETGEIRYLINNSFMNHKYVIFEEMFDAHPSTLLSLKDILTSKRFRKGSQNEPIKTKMIIGLTNKTKDEFSTDNTKKAFADRFQYVHRFEWDDVGVDDYITLFRKRFGTKPEIVQEYAAISNLIHNFNSQGTTDEISPRTAVHIMNAHLKGKTLKFIPGLSHELITKYEKTIISNTSTFGAAKAVYDQFVKVAEENSIILKQISPASPGSLSSAAIMLAKMRGEDEVLVTTNFHNKQVISDASTEEFIKHTTTQLEKAIDALSDEKEKEEVTLLLAHVQLLTVKK